MDVMKYDGIGLGIGIGKVLGLGNHTRCKYGNIQIQRKWYKESMHTRMC